MGDHCFTLETDQRRYEEFLAPKRDPESLIYAIQGRVVGVECWTSPTTVTEHSDFIGPRQVPVHNTGHTSRLELKLAPEETRVVAPGNYPSNISCPVKNILFDGFANVRLGDTITAYFFNGEIRRFHQGLPEYLCLDKGMAIYVARDMKEIENAFKILVGRPPNEEIYHAVIPEIPPLPERSKHRF